LSASLGVALFPDHAEDASALISRADVAMYESKRRGKGGYEIYSGSSRDAMALSAAPVHDEIPRVAIREPPQPASGSRLDDLREANERLVIGAFAAQDRLRHLDEDHRRQIEFLAMVAHELRSPLAPLATAAELLKHALVDERALGQVQAVISRQVAHMSRLVDDLLEGSIASTGKFRVVRQPVSIPPVISQAVESCRPAMEARRQEYTQQVTDEPLLVEGDPVRLAQVFSNLLNNASKYTPAEGKIHLRAELRDNDVVITVSDNGIGVSAAALPKIFDLFVREERAVANQRGGLGIGLAVVRELVEAHGGSVSCSSPGQDKGSKFTVVLPSLRGRAATR
jgi:signal transduction histidine kinase